MGELSGPQRGGLGVLVVLGLFNEDAVMWAWVVPSHTGEKTVA